MVISPALQYLTRVGTPVKIYSVNAGGDNPIHGAYFSGDRWVLAAWTKEGLVYTGQVRNLDIVRQA